MKNIFKIIATFFAIIMLFACTANETEILPEYIQIQNSESNDMEGLEIVISKASNISVDKLFNYDENTLLYDYAKQRISDVEEFYNCKILINNAGGNAQAFTAGFAANLDMGDISYLGVDIYWELNKLGVHYSLDELTEYIDFKTNDVKWGSPYAREIGMVHGTQYSLYPFSWPEKQTAVQVNVYANEALVKQYNFTDPREYLETETWNWDRFTELLELYYFTGNNGNQVYSCTNSRAHNLVKMAILSNGVEMIISDGKGNISSGITSKEGMAAVEWAFSLNNYAYTFYGGSLTNSDHATPFIAGESVLMVDSSDSIIYGHLAFSDLEEIAFLPFPVGPDGEYGKWAAGYESVATFSIFYNTEEVESVAKVFNSLFEPLDAFPTWNDITDYMTRNYFSDSRDAAVYMSLWENARFTYWLDGTDDAFWSKIGSAITSMSASQAIDSYIDSFISAMSLNGAENYESIQNLKN